MAIYTNSKYRLKRNSDQEIFMKKLVEARIFSSYSEILTVSALIGYNNNLFTPITKAASDGVLMQFFNEEEKDLMDILAYCYFKKQSILREDKKYEVYESYANGGFPVLISRLGITNDEDEVDRKKVLTQYFMLLATNGLDFPLVDYDNIDR
jgi:hypothetical protein